MAADRKPEAGLVVSLRSISKSFGPRRVLDGVNFDVVAGQVHALLGQNGSGKSTLIKILSGIYEADRPVDGPPPGIFLRDEELPLPLDSATAASVGIAAVHQDLPIIGSATVLENLRMGRFRTGRGWRIDWRLERKETAAALLEFGIRADPEQKAGDLPEADRAMLAILRGLQGLPADRPGLLILDEPTAHLPRDGVDRVFAAIRQVARRGHGVVLVTHRLDEVFAITDRVSVIRDGRVVYVADTAQSSERTLIDAILGFDLDQLYPEREERVGEEVFRVENLRGKRVNDLNFAAHRGEVLGITGLIGAGQEEIPYLLFGAHPGRSGKISLGANSYDLADMTPRQAIQAGLALLPADRREASGIGSLTVRENVGLPVLDRFFTGGRLREGREKGHVSELLRRFEVRPPAPDLLLSSLSGGNQQKALLAKWFQLKQPVLLLHEPTHGVDIGSRRTIFRLIKDAAEQGAAVILFSAEYADLANLCDRVIIMRHGRAVAQLGAEALSEERILALCMLNDSPRSPSPGERASGSQSEITDFMEMNR